MTALFWAVALSVVSAVAYASAAVAQQHYAERDAGTVRRWLVPLLLNGAGGGLHVIALQFGAVGVVQALGALTVIFALPIAAWRTRRPLTAATWQHAGLTVVGLGALLALTTAGPKTLTPTGATWLAVATAVAVAGCALVARGTASAMTRSLLLAGAAGAAFGVSSVLTKTATSELLAGDLPLISAFAIAGFAATGQVLSQLSFGPAGMAAPLAMASVANPVVAGAVGVVLLGDTVRFGTAGTLLAVAAALVTMRGVIGLSAMSTAAAGAAPHAGQSSGAHAEPVGHARYPGLPGAQDEADGVTPEQQQRGSIGDQGDALALTRVG